MARFEFTKVDNEMGSEHAYKIKTDIFMSDGTYKSDYMILVNGKLVRPVKKGYMFLGMSLQLNLGPISLAKIQSMNVGDTIILG